MQLKRMDGDYVADGIGGLVRLSGKEELLERVLYRLSVPKGSFALLPELGSELYLLSREKPAAQEAAAKQYVAAALAEEKGLSVENVELSEGGDGVLLLYVRLRADGEETVLTLSLGGGLA